MRSEGEPIRHLPDGAADYGNGTIGPSTEDILLSESSANLPPGHSLNHLYSKLILGGMTLVGSGTLAACTPDPNPPIEATARANIDQAVPIRSETSQSSAENKTQGERIFNFPFDTSKNIKIQQPFGLTHAGFDYILGEIDKPDTWQSFPILAAADGEVALNPPDREGTALFMKHVVDGKTYYTYYGHIKDGSATNIPPYEANTWKKVRQGEKIGEAGNTGTQYTHLDFRVLMDIKGKMTYVNVYGLPENTLRENYPDNLFTNGKLCGPTPLLKNCPKESIEKVPASLANPLPTVRTLTQDNRTPTPKPTMSGADISATQLPGKLAGEATYAANRTATTQAQRLVAPPRNEPLPPTPARPANQSVAPVRVAPPPSANSAPVRVAPTLSPTEAARRAAEDAKNATPAPEPTKTINDWETYKSPDIPVSIKIPAGWKTSKNFLYAPDADAGVYINKVSIEKWVTIFDFLKQSSADLQRLGAQRIEISSTNELLGTSTYTMRYDIPRGTVHWFPIKRSIPDDPLTVLGIYMMHNGYIVSFEFGGIDKPKPGDTQYIRRQGEVFQKMLQTIKFLD